MKSPYSAYFQMTNKDPSNYVLFKDFYFYSIISTYLFYFWFLASTLLHYDELKTTDEGNVIIVFDIIVIVGTFIILSLALVNKERFPYPLAGIIFLIFLVELSIMMYYYDKRDLDPEYARDPVSIGITFLLVYTFVSYFTC